MSEKSKSKLLFLTISGQQDPHEGALQQSFSLPPSLWQQWYSVSFRFRMSENRTELTNVECKPEGMIWVKRRWYHDFADWFWLKWTKFKKDEPTFARLG